MEPNDAPDRAAGSFARAPVAGIDTSVYGMPAFVTLRVADLRRSVEWYVAGLGLHLLATMGRTADDQPALVHLRRWRYQDILLIAVDGPVEASSAVTLSFAALADELPTLAETAARAGGGRVTGPQVAPWGTTDMTVVDPDGHTLVFTAPPAVPPKGAAPDGFTMETFSDVRHGSGR